MNNRRPRTLRREFGRWLLIRRAKRIKFEREMADLDDFLAKIRDSARKHPIPKEPHEYAD